MTEANNQTSQKFITDSPKVNFFLGLILGIALISTAAYFTGGFSNKDNQANNNANNNNQAANQQNNENEPAVKVDLKISDNDHVRGNKNAPVKIFEFSDFQCPYCARHQETMAKIVKEYGDQVVWVFKNFPIASHPLGMPGSLAAECAGEQDKFWEMSDMIFANQDTLSEASFSKFAGQLNLDTDKFNTCIEEEKYKEKILADYNLGVESGVQGTPTNFINNNPVPGAVPYENLKTIIDQLLKK
ncbi:MAG TPA: thioredoxin domain-containing protein [bacterium]|nr:thioredoxin domain-containing protein [bacterium]HPL95560.1 thioredoxin domain-containing protein [bacterium]